MRYGGLTVYKASAGSGKTFRLALEYVKILVAKPTAYREILAVTFTNKATAEMKQRILSQLYGLWKGLPDSRVFMATLRQEMGEDYTESLVAERAGTALKLILHDYHHLRVETIDSFFQRTLRCLARELDLATGLTVDIGDTAAEQQAVEALANDLKAGSALLGWMLSLANEQMDGSHSWNVVELVKRFGENIFRDFYKENAAALSSVLHRKGFFADFSERLRNIRETSKQKIIAFADAFDRIMADEGLTIADLANGKNGVGGYFGKLKTLFHDSGKMLTKRVAAALDEHSASCWVKKADMDKGGHVVTVVEQRLIPLLDEAEATRKKELRSYKSADLTLRHLSKLRLLGAIEQKVRDQNGETGRFLLSDTQTLLQALMKDDDAPFVFEKTGSQTRHVMIDEFQDTSTVQWRNFKTLLKECLSHSSSSGLIVGDVKQSIYRWRSGDWRLLNNIEEEFSGSSVVVTTKTLDTNYRSARSVVAFNNAFFELAAEQECRRLELSGEEGTQLRKAYAQVRQELPPIPKDSGKDKRSQGYVQVCLLPHEDYEERTLAEVKSCIENLVANGVRQEDIAILVRSNKPIRMVAERLTRELPALHFVSDEAFRIDASVAVNMIVDAMRLIADENDTMAAARLSKAKKKYIAETEDGETVSPSLSSLSSLSLYDLAESLYATLGLQQLQDENAYVLAFLDMVANYMDEHVSDVSAFLRSWDETLHEKTVQSDATYGIRLLTIHKSKGLEYDHVIVPFCDWKLELRSTLWCKPTESPYDELPIVPVDYSAKNMKDSIYEPDYIEEHLQRTVDNLNLLYVAFTRASKSLYVWGKRGEADSRSMLIEETMEMLPEKLPGCQVAGDRQDKESDMTLTFGTAPSSSEKTREDKEVREDNAAEANVFKQKETDVEVKVAAATTPAFQFRQSNQSRQFIEDIGDAEEHGSEREYIKTGNVLHYVFSTIRTAKDIDPMLARLESEGLTSGLGMSHESLSRLLHRRIEQGQAAEWFSEQWSVYNECSIVWTDPATGEVCTNRPDRVVSNGQETIVIDFKFAKPTAEHHRQVQKYIGLLRAIGQENVKGYLWYVFRDDIVEVK